MKSGVPWSIRGIDDDIREAARVAARRSGVTVSEWLNDLIAKQAAAEGAASERVRERPKARANPADPVSESIERLTRRLQAMDENSRTTLLELRERLEEIEDHIAAPPRAEISARHDVGPRAGAAFAHRRDAADAPPASSGEPDLGAVAEALRDLEARLGASPRPLPPDPEAASDFEAVKSRLDALLARAPEPDLERRAASLDASLRSLESHLDEARSRLEATTRAAHATPPDEHDPIVDDLAAAVAEIAARQRAIDSAPRRDDDQADWQLLSAMRTDLEALRRAAEGETGFDRISATLADLRRDLPERARLDQFADEIAGIRRLLENTDNNRAIARVEMRIAELARGMEAALRAADAAARQVDPDAVSRLEHRIEEIGGRIDEFLRQAAPVDALKAIHERLAGVVDRVDRLRAERATPLATLETIRAEIVALRGEVSRRAPPRIDHLEAQLSELARRLDTAAEAGASGSGMSELEAQVARLAGELERAAPPTATLTQVEENLARLQDYIAGNREESVEAARSAARAAVREMADAAGDSDLVRALKEDLKNIRDAAGHADQQTQATLGTVQETLTRVVERLARLESEATQAAVQPVREPALATGTYGGTRARASETGLAMRSWAGADQGAEDTRPLEPGSGKPDIAALRELARSATDPHRSDRKADFIAAARRAAQAAALEAAMEARQAAEDAKPGAFSRIGQAIRSRKRPLLLAAAALVLAISALQIFGESPADQPPQLAAVEEEAAPSPVAPPPSPVVAVPEESTVTFAPPEEISVRFGDGAVAPPADGFVSRAPASGAAAAAETSPDELAAGGDPLTAFGHARHYAEEKDFAQAAAWYGVAAEAGMAVAQFRLAGLYERGAGVARDRETAARWYQRAADQGHVGAMHNLAVMMSQGVDGPPDADKALRLFRAAAEYGVADSQYNLGVIHAAGPYKDAVEAYKWFAIAASGGDPEAAGRRDAVAASLDPGELMRARAAVQAWRATPVIAEANSVPQAGDAAASLTDDNRQALVREIQTLLAGQGYDPGPADGFAGPKTRRAVRAFQRRTGADETGLIDHALVVALTAGPN